MFEESVSTIPSIWASMNSWFTPTVLFVFLNLVIGTIVFTSGLGTHKHSDQHKQHQTQQDPQPQQQYLPRSPSMLQRLKSINFYAYRSQEPTPVETHFSSEQEHEEQEQRSPSMLQSLESINLYNYISQEPTSPPNTAAADDTNTALYRTQVIETQYHEDEQNQDQEEEEQSIDEIFGKLQSNNVNRAKSDTKPASGEVLARPPERKIEKSASAKSAFVPFEEEDFVEARRPATVREGKPKATEDDDEVDAKADDFINKFRQQLKLQRFDSILSKKK